MKDNPDQAKLLAERTEKRLIKNGTLGKYNYQVNDMIERGVLVETAKEEDESYEGPVYYVSHNVMKKPHHPHHYPS